jgi:DNA invertase Pin-like site-specific DNA recombinase
MSYSKDKRGAGCKKQEGVRLGRPPGSSQKKVTFRKEFLHIKKMITAGISMNSIAKTYGIHRNTLKRYLDDIEFKMQE